MFLFRFIILLLVFLQGVLVLAQNSLTYHNTKVEDSRLYRKGNDYQKDFLLFVDLLQQSHPAFLHKAPFDTNKELIIGYKQCRKCCDKESFSILLQSVAAKVKDEHTAVSVIENVNLVYPIHFYSDDNSFYIDAVQYGLESCLGKQIKTINGKTPPEILKYFQKVISFDNEIGFLKLFKNTVSNFSLWYQLGLCSSDSLLTLKFEDSTSVKVFPIPRQQINIRQMPIKLSETQQIRKKHGKMPFSFEIVKPGIGWLFFNQCEDRNTLKSKYLPSVSNNINLRDRLEQQLLRMPIFSEFLNQTFQTMMDSTIHTLVIDVRENHGGDSRLCEELLRRLKSSIKGYSYIIRPSGFVSDYYQIMGFNNSNISLTDTIQMQLHGVDKPFDGNLIWIQGEKTFSSAGMLITLAVDNNIGVVIGEKSSFSPNSYGDIIRWTLPNTKVQGFISHKQFFRPNKTIDNEIPLEMILPTSFDDYINGVDPCYNWIISNYY
jgi:hypothetical protein